MCIGGQVVNPSDGRLRLSTEVGGANGVIDTRPNSQTECQNVTWIREFRAPHASPVDKSQSMNTLHDFDYEGRGYHMAPPSPPPKLS